MAEKIIASRGEALRSVSIEQQTLSAILINSLPSAPTGRTGDVAVEMAAAVKNAFSALEKKDEKAVSTLTINVELDTSTALKYLDDLQRPVICGMVKEEIKKALQPGGALFWQLNSNRFNARPC